MAGIYLHVPFCRAKCAYCDFFSIANPRYLEKWADAVATEFANRIHELSGCNISTLYFGGGTPSMLPDPIFANLSQLLYTHEIVEFTVEANPEDITKEKVSFWKSRGVNRISIGIQSLVDCELESINRRHSAQDAINAIDMIHQSGIENISCDLIYGLPRQSLNSWEYSVGKILEQHPTHLSAYCLSYEEGTLLTRRLIEGKIHETADDVIEAMYNSLCSMTATNGFEHYEISNFALAGYRSRHNSAYWTLEPYLGLGPGAHSLDNIGTRRINLPDIKKYISDYKSICLIEAESPQDKLNDLIMIKLRTSEGIKISECTNEILSQASKHLRYGNLESDGTNLYIPENRWLMADAVIRDLFVE